MASSTVDAQLDPTTAGDLKADAGASAGRPSVDLERREDRFIIFVRDTAELLDAMRQYTKELEFPETPVTRTVYFGDTARGLPPGLSIKARVYERERLPGRWELHGESNFDLLELKRTIDIGRAVKANADPRISDDDDTAEDTDTPPAPRGKSKGKRDQMVEIVRLSESILSRATFKSKHRKKQINLGELLAIIDDPTQVASRIDHKLYVYLLETVFPLADYRWLPLIGTEYERTHFVTKDPAMSDVFRATLDKRVTHYSFGREEDAWIGVPVGTEDFSRFEVKTDHEKIAGTALGEWLDEIIVRFRAFRITSKKYRGLTLRSMYNIERLGLRNEMPGERVFSVFESRPVRYKDQEHYVNLVRYLRSSRTFRLYRNKPTLIESHDHFVRGRHKKLNVTIAGSTLLLERDPAVEEAGKIKIYYGDQVPVARVPLRSRGDLNRPEVTRMKKRETRYLRSRGFLVENRKSGRVYKVLLERHIQVSRQDFYVRIEYVGRARSAPNFNAEKAIMKDIAMLHRFLRRDPFLR